MPGSVQELTSTLLAAVDSEGNVSSGYCVACWLEFLVLESGKEEVLKSLACVCGLAMHSVTMGF
jgi:hypothetical protein